MDTKHYEKLGKYTCTVISNAGLPRESASITERGNVGITSP